MRVSAGSRRSEATCALENHGTDAAPFDKDSSSRATHNVVSIAQHDVTGPQVMRAQRRQERAVGSVPGVQMIPTRHLVGFERSVRHPTLPHTRR